MTTYYLSPTDLTFLYQECPRCFYNKVLKIWSRPYTPFPSIFTKIDRCIREALHDKSCEPLLGKSGVFDTTEKTIKSAPIQVGDHAIVLSGKMDIRVNFDDGTVGVIDAKTSDPKDSYMPIYDRQLHAYRAILEYPKEGSPSPVSMLGLLIATPSSLDFDPASQSSPFHFDFQFKPVKINNGEWCELLATVVGLLSGEPPEDNGKCHWCVMQRSVAERGATGK